MRCALRILILLAALVGGQLGLMGVSNADPYSSPSTDPISDDYSPWAWIGAWAPTGTDYAPAIAGDVRDGLNKTGMTISAQPAQTAALTADDWTQLTNAWPVLLDKTYNRARAWSQTAFAATSQVRRSAMRAGSTGRARRPGRRLRRPALRRTLRLIRWVG